jgi:hypothetical protein
MLNKYLQGIKKGERISFDNLSPLVADNLQNMNFFENDLGLAAVINDENWAIA